jgi:hypothetical protein
MLEYGVQVDQLDSSKRTALCFAVANNNTGVVALLLDHGADLKNAMGFCLRDNRYTQSRDVAELLVSRAVQAGDFGFRRITNSQGLTLLDRALRSGVPQLVERLIRLGAKCSSMVDYFKVDELQPTRLFFQQSVLEMVRKKLAAERLEALSAGTSKSLPDDLLVVCVGYCWADPTWQEACLFLTRK